VGQQVPTEFGKFIDLLAINSQGDLSVIELKRNRTPREVVAQVLDYASWVIKLGYDEVAEIYTDKHPDQSFEEAFSERFGVSPPESINQEQLLVIAASELDSSTERIISYLSTQFGVPINAVFFRYFRQEPNEYLARTWLIDPNQAEANTSKRAVDKSGKPPWNGKDYYVNVEEGAHRTWEDCVKYGFISAGQGRWYSRTLESLTPGSRIFVNMPSHGYLGVGIVKEEAVRVKDFFVQMNGKRVSILDAPKKAARMDENADDPERSEYLVRVEWLKTRPVGEPIWQKGMFANQNSVCKLRNKFTLDTLVQQFGLEE
jgi:hypothetical protein